MGEAYVESGGGLSEPVSYQSGGSSLLGQNTFTGAGWGSGGNAFGSALWGGRSGTGGGSAGGGGAGAGADAWETRWGWRLDLESAATYGLGAFTAIPLLLLETHSSHVRFHAYQSLLLSLAFLLLHIVFILLTRSKVLQIIFLTFDITVLEWLAIKAFKGASDLDRFYLPLIGQYADRWVNEEE